MSTKRFLSLIFILFVFGLILWQWVIEPSIQSARFCTLEDEVYQSIKANLNDWLNHFPNDDPVLWFTTASGRRYMVNAIHWQPDSPILFIPTQTALQELLGYAGYVYSPLGPSRPDGRYSSEHLEGNVYCYRFSG